MCSAKDEESDPARSDPKESVKRNGSHDLTVRTPKTNKRLGKSREPGPLLPEAPLPLAFSACFTWWRQEHMKFRR
jgi:hypothetical protein